MSTFYSSSLFLYEAIRDSFYLVLSIDFPFLLLYLLNIKKWRNAVSGAPFVIYAWVCVHMSVPMHVRVCVCVSVYLVVGTTWDHARDKSYSPTETIHFL